MIHEFALDPACASDWKIFKNIIGETGVQHGRLISWFPPNWIDLVFAACDNLPPIKRATIISKYLKNRKYLEQKLGDFNRSFIKDMEWRKNAINQHAIKPFHAIISLENPEKHGQMLIAEDIDDETDLWCIPTGKVVPRKAYDLAVCAKLLLNISREILIIDPNFKPYEARFIEPLKYLLQFAFEINIPKRFELHVEYKMSDRSPDFKWLKNKFISNLKPLIPSKARMHVLLWKEEEGWDKPHARYILTERGGICFDYGLDESAREGQTTDVSLLDHNVYEKRWYDYQRNTAAYQFYDDICITGTKK